MLTTALIVSALANVLLLWKLIPRKPRLSPNRPWPKQLTPIGHYEMTPSGAVLVGPPLGPTDGTLIRTAENFAARYEREGCGVPFHVWVAQQKVVRAP